MTCHIIECEQGTPEWHMARAGVITASMFSIAVSTVSTLDEKQRAYVDAILAGNTEEMARAVAGYKAAPKAQSVSDAIAGKPTISPSSASVSYCDELAFERISGMPYGDTYQTYAMRRGSEEEMWARARYEELYDVEIVETGIALTSDRKFGYSTDGQVGGKRGGIEIKTPSSTAKLRELVKSLDPSEYEHQVQGGMWIRGWEWVDNIIWMPQLKNVRNEILVKRVYRDDNFIERMERQLLEFDARVEEAIRFWSTPFRRDGLDSNILVTDAPSTADPVDAQPKPARQMKSPLAALLSA